MRDAKKRDSALRQAATNRRLAAFERVRAQAAIESLLRIAGRTKTSIGGPAFTRLVREYRAANAEALGALAQQDVLEEASRLEAAKEGLT